MQIIDIEGDYVGKIKQTKLSGNPSEYLQDSGMGIVYGIALGIGHGSSFLVLWETKCYCHFWKQTNGYKYRKMQI